MNTQITKKRMTVEEATYFDHHSDTNAMILARAAQARGCQCNAYTDWFTYNRWAAQGYQVKRGEHGVKITTMIDKATEDMSGVQIVIKRPWSVTVFCRCQVTKK